MAVPAAPQAPGVTAAQAALVAQVEPEALRLRARRTAMVLPSRPAEPAVTAGPPATAGPVAAGAAAELEEPARLPG